MGRVLRLRTKLLLCGAMLAPASILLFRMYREAFIREAQEEGALSVWVDPGQIVHWMLYLGLICFLGFLISLVIDFRSFK
jgi:hypothetical protein